MSTFRELIRIGNEELERLDEGPPMKTTTLFGKQPATVDEMATLWREIRHSDQYWNAIPAADCEKGRCFPVLRIVDDVPAGNEILCNFRAASSRDLEKCPELSHLISEKLKVLECDQYFDTYYLFAATVISVVLIMVLASSSCWLPRLMYWLENQLPWYSELKKLRCENGELNHVLEEEREVRGLTEEKLVKALTELKAMKEALQKAKEDYAAVNDQNCQMKEEMRGMKGIVKSLKGRLAGPGKGNDDDQSLVGRRISS